MQVLQREIQPHQSSNVCHASGRASQVSRERQRERDREREKELHNSLSLRPGDLLDAGNTLYLAGVAFARRLFIVTLIAMPVR